MDTHLVNLSPEQIRQVEAHVNRAELRFSHLQDDLVDHMCCYIEELLQKGVSFDDALYKVVKEVGLKTLKNIELETIILLNQKFKTMKTTLKISGILGIGAFFLSLIFKLNHWSGAAWLMFIGSMTLVVAYFPALFVLVKKERILNKNKRVFLFGAIASLFIILHWMFTINHWPFVAFVRIGYWASILVFLVVYLLHSIKNEENRLINISMVLMLSFMFFSSFIMYSLIVTNPRNLYYESEYNIGSTIKLYEKQNKELQAALAQDSVKNAQLANLEKMTLDIIEELEEFKTILFQTEAQKVKSNSQLVHFFSQKRHGVILEQVEVFQEVINPYSKYMLELASNTGNEELTLFISDHVAFKKQDYWDKDITIYNNLNRLKRDILIGQNLLLLAMNN